MNISPNNVKNISSIYTRGSNYIVLDYTIETPCPTKLQLIKKPFEQPLTPLYTVKGTTIINYGATNYFVNKRFIRDKGLSQYLKKLNKPKAISIANERKSRITYSVEINLVLGQHYKQIVYLVIPKLNYPIILGIP